MGKGVLVAVIQRDRRGLYLSRRHFRWIDAQADRGRAKDSNRGATVSQFILVALEDDQEVAGLRVERVAPQEELVRRVGQM